MTSERGVTELQVMRKLRAVLKASSRGRGLAASFVDVFSESRVEREREAVKRILLGTPIETAFSGLVSESGASGELLRFIGLLGRINSAEASRGAERLSSMFERWSLLKEKRTMERKVMQFRGMIVSTVAGVVVGMLSTLAPIVSNFQISLSSVAPVTPTFSPWEGGVLLFPSALALGFFLSPERPYFNVAASLAAFAGVVYFLGPLASFNLAA